jgi:glycosyltransferase involved in cell wall biosynthesis
VSELEKDFNFQLWIVGEGDERKKLEELIRERDIRSVSLLGYQTNPYSFMSKADLYVCSSIYEGYSTVVTEALTLALPVLTTDCAGMNEILDGGEYGMIVSNTEEALKEGLTRFLSSPDIYQHYKQKALEKSSTLSNQIAIREFGALFEADRLF